MYDIRGVLIKQNTFMARTKVSLSLEGLEGGIYFFTIYNLASNTSVTKRIINK
ncbi:hypothetical protein EAX61_04085 [Dokdonia sinensis]|uniref:Uncharacterized protein n=1 Tax=Dokdonia sinensis TaxID=2479847 RepID=A0A3M0GD98_9FLAO|nr:hypothetical protein EAX61_04085 [Dokdonia sinensis]